MSRVLIVTSMFLPYLAADMHRARLLAAELPTLGWDVELLVPGDAFQKNEHLEPNAELLAIDTTVHRAQPEWAGLFRLLNSRSVGLRAYRPMQRLGDRLLSKRHFDLIYFSCSQPIFFHLGVRWRRKFGVPFVLDFHDPWYSPKIAKFTHLAGWKRRISNWLAWYMERATIRSATGLVAVSPKYLAALNGRYRGHDWIALRPDRQTAIPFAAAAADYKAADQILPRQSRKKSPEAWTIVYTGAGGAIMERSFRQICRLLSNARGQSPSLFDGLRIQLFGTEPSAGQAPILTRVGQEEGAADIICEFPKRLSYLEALRIVIDADGLLVLGVDDAAYSPSKLFLYGLTGKPILACMSKDSVVNEYFDQVPGLGQLVHFETESCNLVSNDLMSVLTFLGNVAQRSIVDRRAMLEEWLAPAMARRHANFFNACIKTAA